jgi:hypothetical protein
MPMLFRLAAAIVCFASLVPCQGAEELPDGESADGARRKAAAKGEAGEKREVEENLTPEQRLARNMTSGAAAHCQFFASVKPAKLLPGQTGELKILATLKGNAVLPSPAPLEITSPTTQGLLALGSPAVDQPEAGRIESAYVGRPVYENYAVIRMPVTMAATAAMGSKHTVAIDMKLDLYDGKSAQVIGRFLDRVATEIEVGQTLDPEVKRSTRAPSSEPPKAAATPAPATPTEPAPAKPSNLEGNAVAPTAAPSPAPVPTSNAAPDAEPGQLEVESGGDLPMPLILGGGALLLVVIVMLSRRK